MSVKRSDMTFEDKLFPWYLHQSFNELRQAGLACDVVLAIHNYEWKVHKTVLSAASPYFCAMFNSHFKEANANRVLLHEVDRDSLTTILDFIYSARIELTPSNVFQLMDTSNYFQVSSIKLWINNYLQGNVTIENCVGLYERSVSLSYHDLAIKALIHIRKNFWRVVERAEFLQASGELLTTLMDSNFLNVKTENSLIKAIMKWINTNTRQRKRYTIDLFNKLELRNIDLENLTQLRNETIFMEEAELTEFLNAKIDEWNATTPAESSVKWRTLRYRIEQGVILAIGGEIEDIPTKTVECFTHPYKRWKKIVPQYIRGKKGPRSLIPLEEMNIARTNAAMACDAYNVYILGGRSLMALLSSCEYYNIKSNVWTTMTPLPLKLEGGTAVFFENRLVFIGGRGQNGCSDAVWQWEEAGGTWKRLPSLIHSRAFHSSISYGGYIYTIGGLASDNKTALRSVERYDPFRATWCEVQSMHKARGKFGCTLLNNCIYVMGGVNKGCYLKSVEKYVLESNTWSYAAPMITRRSAFSVAVYEKKIFVIGGTNGLHKIRTIDRYYPLSNRWQYLLSVKSPRCGLVTPVLYVPFITRGL